MKRKKLASWLTAGLLTLGLGMSVMAAPLLRGTSDTVLASARLDPSNVEGRLLLDRDAPRAQPSTPKASKSETLISEVETVKPTGQMVRFQDASLDYTIAFPAGYEVATNTGYEVQALHGTRGRETAFFVVKANESTYELMQNMKKIMDSSVLKAAGFSSRATTTSEWLEQGGSKCAFMMEITQKSFGRKPKVAYFYCSGVMIDQGRTLFTWALSPDKNFAQVKAEAASVAASYERV